MSQSKDSNVSIKKRPTFLTVLLILSSISLVTILFSSLMALGSGPMTEEELNKQEVELAKSKTQLDDAKLDEETQEMMEGIADLGFAKISYIHNQIFVLYHCTQLLIFALGAAGVYYLYRMKKIGFHLYIIYSLLSVAYVYFIFPKTLISTYEISINFVLGAVFVGLYAVNLKYFNETPSDPNSNYEYTN
jgi:hypothetical protein